jgi:hypothetical protein
MHKFKVQPLLNAQDVLTQMSFLMHSEDSRVYPRVHEVNKKDIRRIAGDLEPELVADDFEMCRKGISRLLATIVRTDDTEEIMVDIDDLRRRIVDQLDSAYCLLLSAAERRLYEPSTPLFGKEVEARFPHMSEDIDEAGKSLALNCPTASVFHLMRVMEIGVRRFGDVLGVTLADDKNWQNILDEINKAIRVLDQKDVLTKKYAAASAHLYNVKLASRNEVMHPKQTYTPDEARRVFDATDAFIRDLAALI